MDNKLSLSLVTFLVLFSFALASRTASQGGAGSCQQECQINRITPQEPTSRLQAEGGVNEFWDYRNNQFQCAGVALYRTTLQPKSLVQPLYHSAPIVIYIEKGWGMYSVMISGCPETYESSQQTQPGDRGQMFLDKHQKIEHFRQGDIIAIPAGAAHWVYNSGDEEVVYVVLRDSTNQGNQLDPTPRVSTVVLQTFRLAGSRGQTGNVLRGIDIETLVEVFGVDHETASKLRGENDQRGPFIKIQGGLQVISPPVRRGGGSTEEQEYQPGSQGDRPGYQPKWPGSQGDQPSYQPERPGGSGPAGNGIEETICTAKNRENLNNPTRADIYNPNAGQLSTSNSLTLPILGFLQLSAARGIQIFIHV